MFFSHKFLMTAKRNNNKRGDYVESERCDIDTFRFLLAVLVRGERLRLAKDSHGLF
jgi:hypothetical protein